MFIIFVIKESHCINKNVKHEIVKYSKVEDFKMGTVGRVTKRLLEICIALRFVL